MNDEDQPAAGSQASTLGFIAQREPFESNLFDYLAYAGAAAMGFCGTLMTFFDATSDLLAAHANHVRARRQMKAAADLLAEGFGGDE